MSALPLPSGTGVLNTDVNPILLGWVDFLWFGSTLTYVSADAPTFTFSINADVTGVVEPGMRVRLTQTTDKFFIVTAVGAYAAGVTPITVYGGTDYVLANASISSGAFSTHKKPFGFDASPAKWMEKVSDVSTRNVASPTTGTWFNPSAISLTVPIGAWLLDYQAQAGMDGGGTNADVRSALSTANNSATDSELLCQSAMTDSSAGVAGFDAMHARSKRVTLTAKTTYYMNIGCTQSASDVFFRAANSPTIIRAVCAYL